MQLIKECTLRRLTEEFDLSRFDCGNADLNDFLQNDALNYDKQLLGRTYIFTLDKSPDQIVCFFTVSNDSLRLENLSNNTRRKVHTRITYSKQRKNYPAVLIGRLGVNTSVKYERGDPAEASIGDQLMTFIKAWFSDGQNKTGCRFIVVDAYNEEKVLSYYERNGFLFIKTKGEENRDNTHKPKTRAMFFDLI